VNFIRYHPFLSSRKFAGCVVEVEEQPNPVSGARWYNGPVAALTELDTPNQYTVTTPVYEGPLDLLLHLIERAELDITRVALAQVTDQYLAFLEGLQDRTAEDVSAFLVIAARLIQIKSEALLPRPPIRETGEEDPGEALALQLRLYKRFKQVALWLGERDEQGLRTFLRLAAPPRVEARVDLEGVTLEQLLSAYEDVLNRQELRPGVREVVSRPRVTIRDRIQYITGVIRSRGRATFKTLLRKSRDRVDVVITFLALLELVKRRHVRASQDKLFSDIDLEIAEGWEEDADFELEFEE
jgi:segregation and condensation protein A